MSHPFGSDRQIYWNQHPDDARHFHLTRILGGQILRAPGLEGALVLSQRGGDFVLDVGQDLAIGYSDHDADTVSLYLEESFTFRVTEPDAAVVLR